MSHQYVTCRKIVSVSQYSAVLRVRRGELQRRERRTMAVRGRTELRARDWVTPPPPGCRATVTTSLVSDVRLNPVSIDWLISL